MSISASMVMELRERTGAGMMECKKFLISTNGDIEEAIVEMRKAGQAKADKKADRVAAEGVIAFARSADGKHAVLIEINSETDFVARDVNFTAFANAVAETTLRRSINDVTALSSALLVDSEITVEEARQQLVAKIGENIQLRRIHHMQSDGVVGVYLHSARIGVLISLDKADEALAKDLAMHIAASRPLVVNREDVPKDAIEHERDIFIAQARESGKAQEIIDKMVDGRISKFMDEMSLEGQPFVKDSSMKVGQLLKNKQLTVLAFTRFEVGEGIEKKEDNFVAEVMAQVRD